MCEWIELEKEKPTEDALYLICAESHDPDESLIAVAWYDPDAGWGPQLPPAWLDAITHWQDIKPLGKSECRWEPDGDGVYETDCGATFYFADDGPYGNGFRFCPYCGCSLTC